MLSVKLKDELSLFLSALESVQKITASSLLAYLKEVSSGTEAEDQDKCDSLQFPLELQLLPEVDIRLSTCNSAIMYHRMCSKMFRERFHEEVCKRISDITEPASSVSTLNVESQTCLDMIDSSTQTGDDETEEDVETKPLPILLTPDLIFANLKQPNYTSEDRKMSTSPPPPYSPTSSPAIPLNSSVPTLKVRTDLLPGETSNGASRSATRRVKRRIITPPSPSSSTVSSSTTNSLERSLDDICKEVKDKEKRRKNTQKNISKHLSQFRERSPLVRLSKRVKFKIEEVEENMRNRSFNRPNYDQNMPWTGTARAPSLNYNFVPTTTSITALHCTVHNEMYENSTDEADDARDCSIYVGKLDKSVTEKDLREIFEDHGYIVYIDMRKQPRYSKFHAFIQFANKQQADRAIEMENGTQLRNKRICVRLRH